MRNVRDRSGLALDSGKHVIRHRQSERRDEASRVCRSFDDAARSLVLDINAQEVRSRQVWAELESVKERAEFAGGGSESSNDSLSRFVSWYVDVCWFIVRSRRSDG